MKIIITGGSGLLGQYLNIYLNREHSILTVYNKSTGNCTEYNNLKSDLNNTKYLSEVMKAFQPDLLIHTAAISRPEECDGLPFENVNNINYNLIKSLTEICNKLKCRLVFTSTDLIYDGDSDIVHSESSIPKPISLYAQTKLDSENYIRENSNDYIILRTSLLYGIGLNGSVCNFHNMLNSFKRGERVKLFYDQYRTPLSLHNAAEIINEISKSDIKNVIMNFGGGERISRSDLGEMVCKKFNFDIDLIEKTSLRDTSIKNKVYDVSMNTGLLRSFGLRQMSIEESLEKILSEKDTI
ncbi:MAG: sugar nucleotide-binding protein [Ignavibacteria bacterium]